MTGTASDNLGNSYVFNYRNNYKGDPSFTGPVHMVDHFNLVGNGSAAKLRAGFNIALYPDGSIRWLERGGSLTLGCDPI